jgi:AraC-like DNA-binding protein
MTPQITSSIYIATTRAGVRYIPAHKILARKNAALAIPIGHAKLIPDQLFALDYGARFRVFALEVDRGTELKTSSAARKSYVQSIDQYRHLIERRLYQSHYGLTANLLVLFMFTSRTNETRFLDMVVKVGGEIAKSVLTQVVPVTEISAPSVLTPSELFHAKWKRAVGDAGV